MLRVLLLIMSNLQLGQIVEAFCVDRWVKAVVVQRAADGQSYCVEWPNKTRSQKLLATEVRAPRAQRAAAKESASTRKTPAEKKKVRNAALRDATSPPVVVKLPKALSRAFDKKGGLSELMCMRPRNTQTQSGRSEVRFCSVKYDSLDDLLGIIEYLKEERNIRVTC